MRLLSYLALAVALQAPLSAQAADEVDKVRTLLGDYADHWGLIHEVAEFDFDSPSLQEFRRPLIVAARRSSRRRATGQYADRAKRVASVYLLYRLGVAGNAEEKRLALLLDDRSNNGRFTDGR